MYSNSSFAKEEIPLKLDSCAVILLKIISSRVFLDSVPPLASKSDMVNMRPVSLGMDYPQI